LKYSLKSGKFTEMVFKSLPTGRKINNIIKIMLIISLKGEHMLKTFTLVEELKGGLSETIYTIITGTNRRINFNG